MRALGAQIDENALIKIVLTLATLHNHLKVVSATGAVLFQERLPAWTMPKLCQEALARANRIAAAQK